MHILHHNALIHKWRGRFWDGLWVPAISLLETFHGDCEKTQSPERKRD